ncbi:hypothetical protein VPH35_005227 [Triticum aestivum]
MSSGEKWTRIYFSCQFTADMIAVNIRDFINTSTYREIAGSKDKPSQYESHYPFTMPGTCPYTTSVNDFDPKFNIAAPGADQSGYFPFTQKHTHKSRSYSTARRTMMSSCKYISFFSKNTEL